MTTLDLHLEAAVLNAAQGDEGAFAILVDASRNAVTSIALAVCRDLATSEDIAQEVYLIAWRRLGELRNPASFLPWIRQITRFTAKTRMRDQRTRERRLPTSSSPDGVEDLLAQAADPRPDAESRTLDEERLALVAETLEALPDESREVIVLFYREGRSTKQVASLLGLSEAAVRKRLERGRARLRQDALARFAEVAQKSAPGVAFTAAVLAATASAPTAAAATAAAASTTAATESIVPSFVSNLLGSGGPGAKWLGPKLLPVAGAALGFVGGAAGVVLGLRSDLRDALDDKERRQLLRLRDGALLTILLASAGFLIADSGSAMLGIFAALVATLAVIYLAWLPRIVRRRYLQEAAGDALEAGARLRARQRRTLVGWLAGALCGLAGLLIGLHAAGQLPTL